MPQRFHFLILLTSLICFQAYAQDDLVILNNEPIKPERYDGIKGNPYLFGDFILAGIMDKKAGLLDSILINYNGYEKNFEHKRKDGVVIALDPNVYFGATFITNAYADPRFARFMSDTTQFIQGLNMQDPLGMYVKIFNSTEVSVIKEFRVALAERELESPGATMMVRNFATSFLYYFIKPGTIESFRLKKGSVLKLIDDKQVNLFVKKEKLKLDNEQDLKKVLAYYQRISN